MGGIMLTYRYVWLTLAGGLTAFGLVAALVAWRPVAVLTFLLLATVVAAGTASMTTQEGQRLPWRRAARTGTTTAAAVVGAGGLIDLLGAWGFGLLVATAAVCPPVVARIARLSAALGDEGSGSAARGPRVAVWRAEAEAERAREPGTPVPARTASVDAPWMARDVGSMDDDTLCLAWRSSYVALQRTSSMARELMIVQRRQDLLDELERRSAKGFSAWLASSPRAAGDPSRYLADHSHARQRPRAEP
jgi:hypothetical protein